MVRKEGKTKRKVPDRDDQVAHEEKTKVVIINIRDHCTE